MAFEDLRIEMKCKDFRIQIEEGLKGDSLSIAAQDHAAGCRPCHDFNQKHIELREWISVCQKITAPKNFQFGVQRKIANGSIHTHNWAWSSLKYIVPTAALVVIGVLTWSFLYTNVPQTGTPLAVINADVPPVKDTAPVQNAPEVAQPQQEQQLATVANKVENSNARVTAPKEENGGGSLEQGANKIPSPETPKGIVVPGNEPAGLSATLISLSKAGIYCDRDMKVLRIRSDVAGSGIRSGDMVKNFDGKTINIVRNGQPLQLTLK